jgi:hypothetical protein
VHILSMAEGGAGVNTAILRGSLEVRIEKARRVTGGSTRKRQNET